jgi:hypothetical protein
MDVETGYTGFQAAQVQEQLPSQSTGNAFREQIEQNRRARAGYTEPSPERGDGSDDEDDLASKRPLQSATIRP